MNQEAFLSISEASRILGVSEAALRQWTDEGKIKAFVTPGGHRRYARPELKRFISAQPRMLGLKDLVVELEKGATCDELNAAFQRAADGPMANIMEYCREPLVSTDFKGNPSSSIVDGLSTMVIGGNMAKVLAWYDNEWAYCCRLADLALYVAGKGL